MENLPLLWFVQLSSDLRVTRGKRGERDGEVLKVLFTA